MNLIEKIITKHDVNNYYFVEYSKNCGCGSTSLVLENNGVYYDTKYSTFFDNREILFKKPLSAYVDSNLGNISCSQARKLAKPHYAEFYNEFKEKYLKDKEVLEDSDYSFYAIV